MEISLVQTIAICALPVNFANLRNPGCGMLWIAAAGPHGNLPADELVRLSNLI